MKTKTPDNHRHGDAADRAKARLRADLTTAMRQKAVVRVRALRNLLAALDNAEAVSNSDRDERYRVHAFLDGSAEVARLVLTEEEVTAIFRREAATHRAAASELSALCKMEHAEALLAQASIIETYLP